MRKLLSSLLALLVLAFASAQQNDANQTLWDALVANEDFSTLVSLLEQAGLAEQLQQQGEYTLLAPTNEAFDNLDQGALDTLMADEELLGAVLSAHLIEGTYRLNDLQDAEAGTVVPLQGEPLEIAVTASGLEVNTANFIATNVENEYSNGLLHVMREVVVPVSLRAQLGLDEAGQAGAADEADAVVYTFEDFDTDADGFISDQEFAALHDDPDLFGDFDTDGDGLISQEEFDANQSLLQ